MSRSRANPKSSNVVAFERLLESLFNSIEKSSFNGCVNDLEKIVYYISGRTYRNTLLSKHLVNQVYNAIDQFIGLYPGNPQPYLLKAVFFARQHKVELALQAYNDIHHHFPWYKEAHYRHKLLVEKLKESLNISRKDKKIIDRVEKLLTPLESHFSPKRSVSSQVNNHYNWQPEVPRYGQEDYARYQKIKEAFERGAVKTDDRPKKNNRPVSRASSQAGLLARFGHYDWQSKMPKEEAVLEWSQQHTPAPRSQEKYIHPNGRPEAVRRRQADVRKRYAGTFSYADAVKSKPQANKKAFRKMGY